MVDVLGRLVQIVLLLFGHAEKDAMPNTDLTQQFTLGDASTTFRVPCYYLGSPGEPRLAHGLARDKIAPHPLGLRELEVRPYTSN